MSEQLHHKAIRLHLLWGYWRPEMTDKGVTQHANQTFGIKGNRGHYDKDLFSGEWMKPLREHTRKVKRY